MAKIKEKKKVKEWVEYPETEYHDKASLMVHQSFKTVDTNADGGGVRVPNSMALNLPYVSVRTLIGAGVTVSLEQWAGGAAAGGIYAQIDALESNPHDDEDVEGKPERPAVLEALRLARENAYLSEKSHVSPRIRQILLPRDGTYVAFSPMPSPGVARCLRLAAKSHATLVEHEHNTAKAEKRQPTLRYIPTSVLPVGGTNSQNVGVLISRTHELKNPFSGVLPQATESNRRVFAMHFKGLSRFPIPAGLMREYLDWRNSINQETDANSHNRQAHENYMRRFADAALTAGERARQMLLEFADFLPTPQLVSSEAPAWTRYLIDPGQREKGWTYSVGIGLLNAIEQWAPPIEAPLPPLTLSSQERGTMLGYIEKALP